jgi:hypothetical protein
MNKDNPNLRKNGGEGTLVGNMLRGLQKNILPAVLDAVGVGDLARAAKIISDDPKNAGLSEAEVEQFFQLYELDMQDRANARQMQVAIATSEETGWLAKNYVYILSSLIVLAAIAFGVGLMYVEIPEPNRRMVEMFADIFLFSGAITVINFWYGSSKGSKDKTNKLKL